MKTLQQARRDKKISQADFLEATGINQFNISKIENGEVIPDPQTRKRLESLFGTLDWLSTAKLPSEKPRRKTNRDYLDRKFLKLMRDVHGLEGDEKFYFLVQMHQYIVRYIKAQTEIYELKGTQEKLIEMALPFSEH